MHKATAVPALQLVKKPVPRPKFAALAKLVIAMPPDVQDALATLMTCIAKGPRRREP